MAKSGRPNPTARRPAELRRSWLFVPGADLAALNGATALGADVAMQEFEDFTIPERRAEGRTYCRDTFQRWKAAGMVAAVRINPLETEDGALDLEAAMAADPDAVLLPKTETAEQIVVLDNQITRLEAENGQVIGNTEIVPNLETAAGLVMALEIARSSSRISAMLVASEDMAADLDVMRTVEGRELDYIRQRFLVDCVAAGVVAIDCPYTFSDKEGALTDANYARSLGYKAKSLVDPDHVAIINKCLTPNPDEVVKARALVQAFETARACGEERAWFDGHAVELPTYNSAVRLIARADALTAFGTSAE